MAVKKTDQQGHVSTLPLLSRHRFYLLFRAFLIIGPAYLGATVLVQLPPLMELWTENRITLGSLLELIPLLFPMLLYLSVPIITAIVVGFVYLGLQERNELVVAQAAGQSPMQLTVPALIFAFIMAGIGYLSGVVLLPTAIDRAKDIEYVAKRRITHRALKAREFNDINEKLMIAFRERAGGDRINNVVINRIVDGRTETIVASHGKFIVRDENRTFLMLYSGRLLRLATKTQKAENIAFQVFKLPVKTRGDFVKKRPKGFFERPIGALLSPPPSLALTPRVSASWQAEGHKRLLAPVLCLTYALICATLMIFMAGRSHNRWTLMGAMFIGTGGVHAIFLGATHWVVLFGPEWIPALYVYPVAPIVICLYLLLRSPRRKTQTAIPEPGTSAHA